MLITEEIPCHRFFLNALIVFPNLYTSFYRYSQGNVKV
jgi:hypothetical protein